MVKTNKVLLQTEGPIATITMNRPEVLNAMEPSGMNVKSGW